MKETMEHRKKVKASRELIMMELDFYLSKRWSLSEVNSEATLFEGKPV